ncbi:alpha/beta fold hydrolase [Lentzea sp. NPDC058436]|uniref:alpha/beta fold hydrolase n=1 Tax=Lentzea sp. NPDC058436 TaxID=3346499 RepID=UPI0036663A6B
MGRVWRERLVPGEPEIFVAWQEWPQDRALLVIHGGPDWDHSYLRDPLAELDCQLLLPDLRGCGRSGRVAEYHPDGVMDDLVRVLDAFDVERADVLGHSYGGMVAQRFAITHPSRVRSLIVSGSSVLPIPPDVSANARDPWQKDGLTPDDVRAEAIAAAPANVFRTEAMPGYLRRLEDVRFGTEWLRQLQAGTLVTPRLPEAAQHLAALDIPVLLLHGRHDRTFPVGLVEPTLGLIPRARAVVLEEAGHMLHVDDPEGYLCAVREFLDGAAFEGGLELGGARPV